MNQHTIVELHGDGISAELSECVHTISEVLGGALCFEPIDLSQANREAKGEELYEHAVQQMSRHKVALKYPTATTGESPNKILRERCQFSVIHRPVCSIPGIETNFTQPLDIDVVRVATGGTYDDAGQRLGPDTAVSLRVISRHPCRHASRFAFKLAMQRKTGVVSTSKWTIQKVTDGFFEEICDRVSKDYPGIPYRRELFDALLAGIIMNPDRYGVIVCPNEYGDFLSDTACGLIGSIGLGDSSSYAFDHEGLVTIAMFDPSGGTAPDIAGKDLANPMAALLALSNLLRHLEEDASAEALRSALFGAIADGQKTRDIGGELGTRAFTEVVRSRLVSALSGS